jgi:transposase
MRDTDMEDAGSAEGSEEEAQQDTGPDHISRNYWVGGGICLARLRLQHLLLHWPYKVSHRGADSVHGFSWWPSAIAWLTSVTNR